MMGRKGGRGGPKPVVREKVAEPTLYLNQPRRPPRKLVCVESMGLKAGLLDDCCFPRESFSRKNWKRP